MPDLIQRLHDAGFTPLNIVLVVAVVAVWRLSVTKDRKQTRTREEWHKETRKEVETLRGHVKACDDDRQALRAEQVQLREQVTRLKCCPKADCPLRLP